MRPAGGSRYPPCLGPNNLKVTAAAAKVTTKTVAAVHAGPVRGLRKRAVSMGARPALTTALASREKMLWVKSAIRSRSAFHCHTLTAVSYSLH